MIQNERIQRLNDAPQADGRYVLYWMQASQRAEWNHALEFAIEQANELARPLLVCFGLTDDYPQANARHYAFLLDGLAETADRLARRGAALVVRRGSPPEVAIQLAEDAASVVTDAGYLRHQRVWRRELARRVGCRAWQVESDVVVPIGVASDKQEYAARTIRPKLHRAWGGYLKPLEPRTLERGSLEMGVDGLDISRPREALEQLDVDRSVGPSEFYLAGRAAAERRLERFIREQLPDYADKRNDPSRHIQSDMSPQLHFGQISPLEIALRIRDARDDENAQAYLEELLVRRELSMNFVWFNDRYDAWSGLPSWSRATLRAHQDDRRERVYTREQLDRAETHDAYWNAAMREMTLTGKMHNYMRMYWGKKILEWTRSPATAFRWTLEMNNRYFLDGRDPNSFAGVAWVFGKHDRPWQERDVFGTVRYMSAGGLERKFDIEGYVEWVGQLEG
jgi:deoxyribodipyrimidine photo-lyase